jgi:hypothetical protein
MYIFNIPRDTINVIVSCVILIAVGFAIAFLVKPQTNQFRLDSLPEAPIRSKGKQAQQLGLKNSSIEQNNTDDVFSTTLKMTHPEFLLFEIESSSGSGYLMMLREEFIKQAAIKADGNVDKAARFIAGQLFVVSRGNATKEDVIRIGGEIAQRSQVTGRLNRPADEVKGLKLDSSWDVPVIQVFWLK